MGPGCGAIRACPLQGFPPENTQPQSNLWEDIRQTQFRDIPHILTFLKPVKVIKNKGVGGAIAAQGA